MINNNTENKNTTTVYLTPTTRFVAGMTFDNMLVIDVDKERKRVWVLAAWETPIEEGDPLFGPYPFAQNWFKRHKLTLWPFKINTFTVDNHVEEGFRHCRRTYFAGEWDLPVHKDEDKWQLFDKETFLDRVEESDYDENIIHNVELISKIVGWPNVIHALGAAGVGIELEDDNGIQVCNVE